MLPNQITIWLWPAEPFPSQYGYLTYAQWCEREIARVEKSGKHWSIQNGQGSYAGMICLTRNSC